MYFHSLLVTLREREGERGRARKRERVSAEDEVGDVTRKVSVRECGGS